MRRERNLRRSNCLEKSGEPPSKKLRRRKVNIVPRIMKKPPDLQNDGAECGNKKRKVELDIEVEEEEENLGSFS